MAGRRNHTAWRALVEFARTRYRCVALDLPGIGGSRMTDRRGDKRFLAAVVHEVVETLELPQPVVVGHDIGGMVAYAYLRSQHDARAVVLVDTVVPGLDPWNETVRNPRLWHFGFHATPNLPERLVSHQLSAYFDHFFDAVAADPSALTPAARSQYVASYSTPSALTQGFEFYRSFNTDAAANLADTEADKTPILYLRGGHFTRSVAPQVAGLHTAGLHTVTGHTIKGAGHYTPEEQPELLWQTITAWLDKQQQ